MTPLAGAQSLRRAFGGAATIAAGTALGHVVTLASLPLVTRLYGPKDLGVYTLFVACVQLGGVVVTLRYEAGIVSQSSRRAAAQLGLVSAASALILSPLFALGIVIASRSGLKAMAGMSTITAMWAAPVVFLTALYSTLRFAVLRERDYRSVAGTAFAQNVARAITQIAAGVLGAGPVGLNLSEGVGRAAGTRTLYVKSRSVARSAIATSTWRDLAHRARTNKEYPTFSLPSSIADAVTVALLPFLVSNAFTPADVGQLGLAQRAVTIPTVLVGQAVADSFHAHLAFLARSRRHDVKQYFDKTFRVMLLVAVFFGTALVLLGDHLFALVFGPSWALAGTIAAAMTPLMVGQLCVSPLSRAVLVFSGQKSKLVYDSASIILMISAWSVARMSGMPIVPSVLMVSVARLLAYGVYFVVLRRLVSSAISPQ